VTKAIVGYTAGVYDMFHIGHLNLLKAAKEHCDHLIVGVNSDEATYSYKQKYPVITEQERLAIVSSIKYVDEAVLVTNTDKFHAYETFQPDVIIVGDDHKGEQKWEDLDRHLRQNNRRVIYVPYTKHVSSTGLRPKESIKVED
jgi:glycerol-3-phosphate cytidylyltransferase